MLTTRPSIRDRRGQAAILLIGALCGVMLGAFVLGSLARGVGEEGRAQRAADLGALAGARTMHAAYPRLFEPVSYDGRPNPLHLERAAPLHVILGPAASRSNACVRHPRTTHTFKT